MEENMIKVSVLYPNIAGKTFDMEYYCSKHIPMVQHMLGAACKGVAVEAGLGGAEPGAPATYIAMGHLYFDSVEAFQTAFGPQAQAIMGDIPNYTNLQPTIQISDVKIYAPSWSEAVVFAAPSQRQDGVPVSMPASARRPEICCGNDREPTSGLCRQR
jgi:uncharacterized protein (TIGR02118 family)